MYFLFLILLKYTSIFFHVKFTLKLCRCLAQRKLLPSWHTHNGMGYIGNIVIFNRIAIFSLIFFLELYKFHVSQVFFFRDLWTVNVATLVDGMIVGLINCYTVLPPQPLKNVEQDCLSIMWRIPCLWMSNTLWHCWVRLPSNFFWVLHP